MLNRHRLILALCSLALIALPSSAPAADSGGIQSVGIYNCYTGMPTTAIPFFQACGYNTYQRWDLGWTLNPSHLTQYYDDMSQDVARMQNAGFKSYVLLSINMLQRQEGQPEGYQSTYCDPANQTLMQQRLSYIATTVQKLKSADGFTIFAGDPGGYDTATPAQLYDATKQIIAIIRQQAPQAKINVNTWGIAAWDRNPSPFTTQFWQKEVELTNDLMNQPGILGPNVNIEYPLHNYYRSLALTCYAQAGVLPQACPTADQVAALKQRGVTDQWAWPYFLTDECDDGNSPGTAGITQAETRYLKQVIDNGRQLGLNGMVANAMAPNIFPESLNLYAFGRFSNDQTATPDQVIAEFSSFIAQDRSKANLTQVLKFVENNSTWQAGMPAQNRLPDFDVGALRTAADAYDELNGVGVRLQTAFPLPDTPIAYLAKVKQRLRTLAGASIPGASSWTVSARSGTVENGTADGVDADHNLSFTTSADATNILRKNDALRSDRDAVGVTIRNLTATTDSGNWAVAGLVISASSTPSLTPSDPTYSFLVSQNGNNIRYMLSGADGFTTETSQWLSTVPADFHLEISRSGSNHIFAVNGEEIFRDGKYASASMPYFFVEWGSGGGGLMAMNADHFGIVPEPPTCSLATTALVALSATTWWTRRKSRTRRHAAWRDGQFKNTAWPTSRRSLFTCLLLAVAAAVPASNAWAEDAAATAPATKRCGFYLHGCWKYNYPFAIRSWKAADYHNMFLLLKAMGYNTVMLWPVLDAIPIPLTETDRHAVEKFRPIVEDARKCGLETWLTLCIVTCSPEIAEKPWMERSLYAHLKTVRLDDPKESDAYLRHRDALLSILNNADGYVTIDGDPGGYSGAKPADFVKVFLNDRKTIDRAGTHPKTQKIIPWIWAGWGTKGVWAEPIEPFVTASLDAIKQQQHALEPFELLPGRSHVFSGNKRVNMDLVEQAGLLGQSTLLFYEAIDFEPSVPSAALQLTSIRDFMSGEAALLPKSRGVFGNAQTPIMILPNAYYFARCAADPKYVDQPDAVVLSDFAHFLGGPPELLVPAWSCLQLGLDKLPADLPGKLREVKLTGTAASFLPGGASRYMSILAGQVEMRIRLLQACRKPAKTQQEAAARLADGTAALVDWWKVHHYVFGGEGTEAFQWNVATQYNVLHEWSTKNVTDPKLVADLAVKRLVKRKVLAEPIAKDRIAELLKP